MQILRLEGAVIARTNTTKVSAESAPAAEITAFQLSRLYAQGWLAGSNCTLDDTVVDGTAEAEALNPHSGSVERGRWAQGFKDAVQRLIHGPAPQKPQFRANPANPKSAAK